MAIEGEGFSVMLNLLMTFKMHRGLEERWFDITYLGSEFRDCYRCNFFETKYYSGNPR